MASSDTVVSYHIKRQSKTSTSEQILLSSQNNKHLLILHTSAYENEENYDHTLTVHKNHEIHG